ncbi:heparan-alpha-glucosaminide N-acetyltransferase domain-containing protein, partial [Streptomyces bottropensis]|uniref:heparan-alpha-glucosaminide N-acetyltransferase domain-containing protein n=1 Tax=Streptomyces bottropensis TaxID=42235 RepID=UPI0036862FA7
MTEIESTEKPSPPGSPAPAPESTPSPAPAPAPATAAERAAPMTRLVAVDLARALAVFGMFAVHVGPFPTPGGGVGDWFLGLASGRASALFATLAGFSLTLIAGRLEPKTGLAGRQARARILIRAVVLLVLGVALATTNFGGAGILNFYAVYFLLALPLLRLRARTLATVAVALAGGPPPGGGGRPRARGVTAGAAPPGGGGPTPVGGGRPGRLRGVQRAGRG